MEHLSQRDFRALLNFLRKSYSIRNVESLVGHVLLGVLGLIGADLATCVDLDPRLGKSDNWQNPAGYVTAEQERIWEKVMREHPVLTHQIQSGDGRAYAISDFLSRDKFHKLALYNELYRPMRVEDVLGVLLQTKPPHVIGVSLSRKRKGFSERERLLLNLIRPHLIQAWRNARAFTEIQKRFASAQQALDGLDHGVIVLGRDGRARMTTSRARQMIAKYFANGPRRDSRLPETLERWVRQQQNGNGERAIERFRMPMVRECEDGRLVVRLLTDTTQSLLLLEEHRLGVDPVRLAHLGLTQRETEVLAWVAQGKTNPEIASILGLSVRTVQKHLEHIYQKLGVETRTAAAARALEC